MFGRETQKAVEIIEEMCREGYSFKEMMVLSHILYSTFNHYKQSVNNEIDKKVDELISNTPFRVDDDLNKVINAVASQWDKPEVGFVE